MNESHHTGCLIQRTIILGPKPKRLGAVVVLVPPLEEVC